MKNLKKIIILLILIMGWCGYYYHATANDLKDLSEIEQKVLFVYIDVNTAYVETYEGYYIDNEGNVFSFDLAHLDKNEEEKLYKLGYPSYLATMDNSKLFATVDKKKLLKYYNKLLKVNEDAKIKSKCGGDDMGTESFYGVLPHEDGSLNMVRLYSKGDTDSYNTDRNAKKIAKWLKRHPHKLIKK